MAKVGFGIFVEERMLAQVSFRPFALPHTVFHSCVVIENSLTKYVILLGFVYYHSIPKSYYWLILFVKNLQQFFIRSVFDCYEHNNVDGQK